MKNNINIKKSFKLAIDIIISFIILVQGIKKGGFYTSDIIYSISSIIFLGIIYGIFELIVYFLDRKKNSRDKISIKNIKINSILFVFLSIAYFLPILFGSYANLSDSKFEFLRYLSICIIYLIVRNSDSKKIYYYTLIAIGQIQVFIGIDGLASRLLQPYLSNLNSGYLSSKLTRLSGTIQYANTAAILIAISGILLLDRLKVSIQKLKFDNNKYNKIIVIVCFVLHTISSLAIILTGSRSVLVLYVISLIFYLYKQKINNLVLLTFTTLAYIISALASNNILNLVFSNPSEIYFVFLTYIILSIFAAKYIIKYVIFNNFLKNRIFKFKYNNKKVIGIIILILFLYFIIGLNLYKPLKVTNNIKTDIISRQIYGVKNNEINEINIYLEKVEENSKLTIEIYEENNEYIQELIKVIEYDDNDLNKFNFKFTAKENTKRLNVVFNCNQGSINITEFKLNENIKPMEYLILPNDIIFRFTDFIFGSTSLRDRIEYTKDSFKIFSSSPLFGKGGEAFKHLYKDVQTLDYTSTEAHNSILQIFVEAGLIGGISICLIIYIIIRNNKNSVIKLTFVMYIIHSITDLNFSFFICLCVFALLTGIIENEIYDEIDL